MKKQAFIFLVFNIIFSLLTFSQQNQANLFSSQNILPLKLSYSNKEVKNSDDDTTYFKTMMSYKVENQWDSLEVGIRKRGLSRLKNCYFAPIRMKFKKGDIKSTIFEDNKKLKLVLPCLKESDNNDNVVKEYVAYKIYEIVTPYYFKTRLVNIDYEEIKGNKTKPVILKGILKEDDKDVAKRFDGKIFERDYVSPYALDELTSVRNAFFSYLIGNTDFSQSHLHNVKLIYINKKIEPICYDFDMSGLVNASYSAVSEKVDIEKVTDRAYRGVVREVKLYYQVRSEYLENKTSIINCIDATEKYFDNPKEFSALKAFVLDFFDILINETKFKQLIIDKARN